MTSEDDSLWGSDGGVSLPAPLDTTKAEVVDMQGFVFTPYGLRVNLSEIDREQFVREGYGPIVPGGKVYGEE